MKLFATLRVVSVAGSLICGVAAHAHDPLQSTTTARLQPEGLAVEIVMAKANARRLLADPLDGPLVPETFAQFRAPLRECAVGLLEVTGNGMLVEPRFTDATMTPDQDVHFTLTYPRPAGGPLFIQAHYLRKMPGGHLGQWQILSLDRKILDSADLDAVHFARSVALPASPGGTSAGPLPPLAQASSPSSAKPSRLAIYLGGSVVGLGLATLAWVARRRSRATAPPLPL